MRFPLWLQTVFPFEISSNYLNESVQDDPVRCLIDRPSVTMRHPIIDFDVHETCDMILKSAKLPPAARTKPLLGVVRGMGSGKTRCLEELRRELLKRPGVLAIGITFNTIKGIDIEELVWGGNPKIAFALMVIARLASTLYDKDLDNVRELITNKISMLDKSGSTNVGRDMMEEFLRYVVANARSQGKEVNDVVVIVDEVAKTEEKLNQIYKRIVDPCADLRTAVLNDKKTPFTFNATLCISSLKIASLGLTLSERTVTSLGIPSTLDSWRIVKEWWKCKEEDQRIMFYVASCFQSLPRAIEVVGEILMEYPNFPRNQTFIEKLFVEVKNRLHNRYLWRSFPDDKLIYSILFSKTIAWNRTVQKFIYLSILLNSIENISPSGEKNFVPISSLAVLAGSAVKRKRLIEQWTIKIYEEVLREVVRLAGNDPKAQLDEGLIFESFIAKWLKYRWAVAHRVGKQISLAELIGLTGNINLKYSLDIIATRSEPKFVNLTISSNKNSTLHLKEVKDVIVTESNPIAVHIGAPYDKFDLLFKIFQGLGMMPLHFYIDKKSPAPGNLDSKDIYADENPDLSQYERVKKMCVEANVPFLFCYWTHYTGAASVLKDDCFVLREEESEDFFGPMWPMYITCRSTFNPTYRLTSRN